MNIRFHTVLTLTLLTASLAAPLQAAEPVRVVSEGGIRDEWMLADGVKLVAPAYPAAFARRGDNVCMAVGYLINPDGTTSDFSLLKAWASSTGGDKEPEPGFWAAFAKVGAVALAQWRFKPRPEVASPRPTYTVSTMTMMGKQAEDIVALRKRCAIEDLAATKAALEDLARRRPDMNKYQVETALRDAARRAPAARPGNPSRSGNPR